MKILALDLGKFNSVSCFYDTLDAGHGVLALRDQVQRVISPSLGFV
jgi:hypothetical protein